MSVYNSSANSKKEEKGRNIQVVVRCRPFNAIERKAGSHSVVECDRTRREVNVRTGGSGDKAARKNYTFDMVFGATAKQIDVYRSVVCPILDEVIMGYNCTIFAYGQTGTGKTFTMEGESSPDGAFTWEEDPLAGIIPRSLCQIFEKLSENGTESSVKVSLLEIYNEELFDLLSPCKDAALQIFDDPRNKRGVIIKGLEEITVHNKEEVYNILERGSAKRKTASTLMNTYSSRSHSVFSVTIHMKETTNEGDELIKIGKLNLVDLAGSENIGRSGSVDMRAREAGNINQSLLTLGRVITALVERAPHVPYRESKLTRILQDSLGGRTKTSIIATVSPASHNIEETLSTLDYANRAKNILNKPEMNQKMTKRALLKEYTEEIEHLKRDLFASREKNGVYLSYENYDCMNCQIVAQETQIVEFTEKISVLDEELKRLTELFSYSKLDLEQCTENLQSVKLQLEGAQADLEQTKRRLSEEQFVVSALEATEGKLYSTANKLLTTIDASTTDVSALHEKLDRKKAVEEHNTKMQQSFSKQMDTMFSQMQKSVNEQNVKHQGMLSLCSGFADLLDANATVFGDPTTTITKAFKGIKDLFNDGMIKFHAKMEEQELLCLEGKDSLLHILEEHTLEMEKGIFALIMPGLNAQMERNKNLEHTLQSHSTLAEKMEVMSWETTSFFTEHTQALARLQDNVKAGLRSLQTEQDDLKQEINTAGEKHATGVSQVFSCLQAQLNLLALETQTEFNGLLSESVTIQEPLTSLKKSVEMQCTDAEQRAGSQHSHLETTADGLVAEIRQAGEEGMQKAEEYSGQTGYLKASASEALGSILWCDTTRAIVGSSAEDQLSKIKACKASAHAIQQSVEESCDECVQEANMQQQNAVLELLELLGKQICSDQAVLQDTTTELAGHPGHGLTNVYNFLTEELKQDVPTGKTPQRKDYVYPRVLVKSRNRDELLENFRKPQHELQAALTRGGKKEKSFITENGQSPMPSKLPLRIQI